MPILPIEDRHTLINNSNISTCLIRSIALPFHTLIAAVLGQRENNLFDVGTAWRRRQKITSRMRTLFILSRGVGVLRSQGRYCKARSYLSKILEIGMILGEKINEKFT